MIDTTRSFTITVTIYADTYAQAHRCQQEIQSNLASLENPEDFFVGSVMEATEPKEREPDSDLNRMEHDDCGDN